MTSSVRPISSLFNSLLHSEHFQRRATPSTADAADSGSSLGRTQPEVHDRQRTALANVPNSVGSWQRWQRQIKCFLIKSTKSKIQLDFFEINFIDVGINDQVESCLTPFPGTFCAAASSAAGPCNSQKSLHLALFIFTLVHQSIIFRSSMKCRYTIYTIPSRMGTVALTVICESLPMDIWALTTQEWAISDAM
jgi:hypothetical protein